MLRCTTLPMLLLLSTSLSISCASQPICRPWSPEPTALAAPQTLPAGALAGAVPAAAHLPPAEPAPDDGTLPLAAPSGDDAWLSVVGEGGAAVRPRGSSAAPARRSATAPTPATFPPAARAAAPPRVAIAAGSSRPRPPLTPAQIAAARAAWPLLNEPDVPAAELAAAPPAAAAAAARQPASRPAAIAKPVVARPPAVAAPVASKPTAVAKLAVAKPAAAKPAANPAIRGEARQFFAARCVMCHGEAGRGDGPTGKTLTPQPRNFTDRTWQASVTNDHIEKVIINGGPAIGKSPLMPPHGDLSAKPELLHAMRDLVRELGR
jgi:hypothetical protein